MFIAILNSSTAISEVFEDVYLLEVCVYMANADALWHHVGVNKQFEVSRVRSKRQAAT